LGVATYPAIENMATKKGKNARFCLSFSLFDEKDVTL